MCYSILNICTFKKKPKKPTTNLTYGVKSDFHHHSGVWAERLPSQSIRHFTATLYRNGTYHLLTPEIVIDSWIWQDQQGKHQVELGWGRRGREDAGMTQAQGQDGTSRTEPSLSCITGIQKTLGKSLVCCDSWAKTTAESKQTKTCECIKTLSQGYRR